jgi:undecaprenyl-diphosphatase
VVGLFLLVLLQSGRPDVTPLRDYRSLRPSVPRRFWIGVIATVLIVSAVWLLADRVLIGVAEGIQSDWSEAFIRIINRFGGGMNPPMIVLFFLIAGLVYRRRTWIAYSVAMALAGLGAGLFAQILKFIVGRTRPELWLGPFHYARGGANSFPSGHTVGAFALAGVLLFASRSIPLRVTAITLAAAVGAARIMAFRHWPSDVVASAAIGLLAAAAATSSVMTLTSASGDNSYSAARE